MNADLIDAFDSWMNAMDAREVIAAMVVIRSTAVDGVLTVSPRTEKVIWKLAARRDYFRMLGEYVEAIERELDDGLGELRLVVDYAQ